ncbi:MAG: bifunctional phosphoglucose/phosphomannose isomerase [Euryarchaeota archaeon]|nr:bifunctional phosphoglucose/phosphomannose isomerase [Euryarchaeota archaeon]
MVELLDDVPGMRALDPSDILGQLSSLPDQLEWSKGVDVPAEKGASNVIVCGVGGSAIAGDVICDLLSPTVPVPLAVSRDVVLPGYAGKGTLCIVVSYSGNTAESLDQYDDAMRRGCRIAAITSGGKLEQLAMANSQPLVRVPAGNQPRASLGYLLGSLALLLQGAGLGNAHDGLLAAAPSLRSYLGRLSADVPAANNQAKRLAKAMEGKVPAVYAPRPVRSVALRWQNQMNENAKTVAFSGEVPEMDHNQLVSWLEGGLDSGCRPVMLMPSEMRPTIKRMSEVTLQMLNERGLDPIYVALPGEGLWDNVLQGIALGDMASYYMAVMKGVDPAPVTPIKEFKERIGH